MDRFDPFVKYADVYGDIINWEKDPMNKPQNQNKYFFSDGKTYYEQICKMLRLMSVFKEAFNQIYSNEDEISEAWENFVNNLSASVVEGSEPDVTLTWTDDSVNFEFTMVPGVPGEQGVGITSISFNSDYTMTITLSDGNTYTSMSLKGETGPQGPQGETGSGLQILDVYATLADLQSAHPTGQPGDAYQVGSEGSYTLYIWSSSQSAWIPAGSLGTVSPSLSNPLMDGTASAGSLNQYSRGDHVHPSDTSRASQEELDALIKTSQALIDQSFTYRESPAIQDGLARFDKIKGNSLVWNQLVQNGNFADTSGWIASGAGTTLSVANNEATLGITAQYSALSRDVDLIYGHKYFVIVDIKASSLQNTRFGIGDPGYYGGQGAFLNFTPVDTNYHTYRLIGTLTESAGTQRRAIITNMASGSQTLNVKNFMVIDLTKLGLDISADEFLSLFSLPYYDYNAGTLLSFNGTGLKTTGKNLLEPAMSGSVSGVTFTVNNDGSITVNGTATSYGTYDLYRNQNALPSWAKAGKTYTLSLTNVIDRFDIFSYDSGGTSTNLASISSITSQTFTIPNNAVGMLIRVYISSDITYDATIYPQIEIGTSATSYEPYTSSTLSLPISTYFPTGMKSAGIVYDELTETKAITRIDAIDLGTLSWKWQSTWQAWYTYQISESLKGASNNDAKPNIVSANYPTLALNSILGTSAFGISISNVSSGNKLIAVENGSDTVTPTGYLYYELATPTETSVDLDLSFNAYEDGTEQLLPVNGSVPSTSPVIADMTYLSIDDAMEYIIDKLANVPQNTQQILESLEDDVADLQTDVGALQPAVSALQTSVGNINTNIGQLSSTVAGHTSSISDMQSDISDLDTGLNNLEDTVTDNTSRIGTLETGLSATNRKVQNLSKSVSGLDSTVTAQGETVTALDSIIQDISNNPVVASLGSHELGFVAANVSATLAANTGTKVTIPKPTIFPNNYTPLFIVGMTTGSYNVSICEIPYSFGKRDSVNCRVWNHGSEQTTQITVYILCMRQRQSQ